MPTALRYDGNKHAAIPKGPQNDKDLRMHTRPHCRSSTLYSQIAVAMICGVLLGLPRVGSAAAPPAIAADAAAAPQKLPPVPQETGSFDVGLMLGSQIEHNGLAPTLSMDALLKGLKEAMGGRTVTADERDTALRYMREAREVIADKNRAAAKLFLEKNSKESGVKMMPSGLQYRVLAAGDAAGKPPLPTDTVTVRYKASLADGTVFDRSDSHERPATFRVNSVFKGWQEAFSAMKPGAKWQLFVPPELGYGANSPPMVPPGALLIYELELLQVEPAAAMNPTAGKQQRISPGAPPPGQARP